MDTSSLFKLYRSSRPITYQEAHDELLTAYDMMTGLDTGTHHVGTSEQENPYNGCLYEYWMATYIREQIGDVFRISFDEFLNRPRGLIMMMIKQAQKKNREMAAAADAAGLGVSDLLKLDKKV